LSNLTSWIHSAPDRGIVASNGRAVGMKPAGAARRERAEGIRPTSPGYEVGFGGIRRDHGFRVIEAENADDALKRLETRDDVRLLFTNIQMPGSCDGVSLARQVHARWPHVLLVITSGQIRPAQAEIPDDGRFLGKPYGETELFDEVNDLMRKV
jgi:two-component system, response regulator PdtaR